MYVFGIDMPIMEILFVVMFFMIIALTIIIWYIRKLRKLIITEQADIHRFEEDIDALKPHELKKHTDALDEFIKLNLEKGQGRKDIEDILLKKGWPTDLIAKGFLKMRKK